MSRVDVVTVFAPRESAKPSLHANYLNWRQYLPLLELQRKTAQKFGHRHIVVCDQDLPGFEVLRAELPENLMQALIAAQLAFFRQWDEAAPIVLLDVDCLVARNLSEAFDGTFEIGVTNRENPAQPINNGAMYFAPGSKAAAITIFERVQFYCDKLGNKWGDDQIGLGKALRPVPNHHGVEERLGVRVSFLSMLLHNVAPLVEGKKHRKHPFIVHFKGDRKAWMKTYADRHIFV